MRGLTPMELLLAPGLALQSPFSHLENGHDDRTSLRWGCGEQGGTAWPPTRPVLSKHSCRPGDTGGPAGPPPRPTAQLNLRGGAPDPSSLLLSPPPNPAACHEPGHPAQPPPPSSHGPHVGGSPDSHPQASAHTVPSSTPGPLLQEAFPDCLLTPPALCTFWPQSFPPQPGNHLPSLRVRTRVGSPQMPSTTWARVERRAAFGKFLWHQTGPGIP